MGNGQRDHRHHALVRACAVLIAALLVLASAQPQPDYRVGDVDLSEVIDTAQPDVVQGLQRAGARGDTPGLSIIAVLREHQYPEGLWETLTDDFGAAVAVADWRRSRTISLAGHDGWLVPTDPTWHEDPFADPSWVLQYQSLAWLQAAWIAGDRRAVATLVMDWIKDNPVSAEGAAWGDHAIAYRTDTLVKLLAEGLASELQPRDLASLLNVLYQHGVALRRFLDDPAWVGHNHNLFHALSLFNLAVAIPQLARADEWRNRAHQRVNELLSEMVDPIEGISTEQSIGYHFVALDLFATARDWLARRGAPLGPQADATLAKMHEFGALITHPDGSIPAIGDTSYGAPFDGRHFDLDSEQSAVVRWVLSRGQHGTAPPELTVFERTGYAIFRVRPPGFRAWADQTHVVADVGPSVRGHGHQDALSFVLYGRGHPVIIDPGGPYLYRWPERQHFLSVSAHNAVMVDGLDFGDESGAGDVQIDGWGATQNLLWLIAHHDKFPGVRVARAFLLLDGRFLLLLDAMKPSDSNMHSYTLGLHFPPATSVQLSSSEVLVQPPEGAAAQVVVKGSAEHIEPRLIEGQHEPRLAGWVTPALGRLEPAPLVQWTWSAVGTTTLATVINLAPDQEDVRRVDLVEEGQDDRLLIIETSRGRYLVRSGSESVRLLSPRDL